MSVFRMLPAMLTAIVCMIACAAPANADLKLPAIFNHHMVLQRDARVPVWGWATPGQAVTVTLGEQSVSGTTDETGRWRVTLDPLPAGGPYELTITSNNQTTTLNDVMLGEVWLCSGQSNMDMRLENVANAAEEIKWADHPNLRLFRVERAMSNEPQDDVEGVWASCAPDSVKNFSAVAYFLGRELHLELDVPVGLIHCAYGGTPAEAWTSRQAIEAQPALASIAEEHGAKQPDAELDRHDPYVLYNAMLHPLVPYAIRGATWYQGESNTWRSRQYEALLGTMIEDWRALWDRPALPFGVVQLTSYVTPPRVPRADGSWPELRESQLRVTQNLPSTGLIVTIDIGNPTDIHPLNKQDIGHRLALWALDSVYDRNIVSSGPVFREAEIKGSTFVLSFDHVGSGLTTSNGEPLRGFVIAGPDRKFRWAKAEVLGDQIIVSESKVTEPMAVRYAWDENPYWANLVNAEGLPASPFRTDDWPGITDKSR